MSYISFLFFGFLFIALALYYIVPMKWRKYVLLCANVVFYAYAGISQIAYLTILIVLTYFSALLLQKIAKHRFLLLLFSSVSLGRGACLREIYQLHSPCH